MNRDRHNINPIPKPKPSKQNSTLSQTNIHQHPNTNSNTKHQRDNSYIYDQDFKTDMIKQIENKGNKINEQHKNQLVQYLNKWASELHQLQLQYNTKKQEIVQNFRSQENQAQIQKQMKQSVKIQLEIQKLVQKREEYSQKKRFIDAHMVHLKVQELQSQVDQQQSIEQQKFSINLQKQLQDSLQQNKDYYKKLVAKVQAKNDQEYNNIVSQLKGQASERLQRQFKDEKQDIEKLNNMINNLKLVNQKR